MAGKTFGGQETLHLSSCINQERVFLLFVFFFPVWSLILQFQNSEPNPSETGFQAEHKY